jgi:Tol biopolymer transport system component/DNA-binding winged helix-turn-helix (wHTH) protein
MIRSNVLYEFGPYRLDPAKRLLLRGGVGVALAPKTFDLLLLLVESQGQVLTKKELMSALWSDAFVEEGNLSFQVAVLRKALGEEGAQWIETVPKHGYRFNGSASGLGLQRVNSGFEVSRVSDPVLAEHLPDTTLRPRNQNITLQAEEGRRRVPWQWLVMAGILVAVILVVASRRDRPHTGRTVRFIVSPPDKVIFRDSSIPAVSPDGKWLTFVGMTPDGGRKLWVREIASLTAEPLTGTELSDSPFWSPDSRSIAFFSGGKLKKIDLRGRAPQTICDAPGGNGRERAAGSWGRDGFILLQTDAHPQLYFVPENGGAPKPATALEVSRQETLHYAPYFLPDGQHFLYSIQSDEPESAGVFVGSLSSARKKRLVSSATNASYAESSDGQGYLLFTRGTNLTAMRFDAKALQLSGEAFSVANHILIDPYPGLARASFSVSQNGVLVYRTGVDAGSTELVWLDRQGNSISRIGEPADYSNPALSPDEKKLAVSRMDPANRTRDLWIFDLLRQTSSRFTFDPADENKPIWSPDGSRLAFNSMRKGFSDIYVKEATGTSAPELLLTSNQNKSVQDWSPDGRFITYRMGNAIWALPLEGEGAGKKVLIQSIPEVAAAAELSPDGRWMAYQTNEANRAEIYVQRLHPPDGKWQLTTAGGMEPHWRHDSKELFFTTQDKLMAVPVKINAGVFEAGTPKALFDLRLENAGRRSRYQVAANGQRFLVNRPIQLSSPIVVAIDWNDNIRP